MGDGILVHVDGAPGDGSTGVAAPSFPPEAFG